MKLGLNLMDVGGRFSAFYRWWVPHHPEDARLGTRAISLSWPVGPPFERYCWTASTKSLSKVLPNRKSCWHIKPCANPKVLIGQRVKFRCQE